MNFGKVKSDLTFIREPGPVRLPPPCLGPAAYARLIETAWRNRTEEDRQRYLMDEGNRPVEARFHLDGSEG